MYKAYALQVLLFLAWRRYDKLIRSHSRQQLPIKPERGSFQVTVRCADKTETIIVCSRTMIGEVKQRIEAKLGMGLEKMRLMSAGKQVEVRGSA